MRSYVIGAVSVLAACSKADPPTHKPALKAPLSVRFGDCAGPDTTWISGPAPSEFDDALAAAQGRVPVTTIETLPIAIERTRWDNVVPQLRVPRAETSSTDSFLPAGDDAERLALRFRPKAVYVRGLSSEPMVSDLASALVESPEPLARCFPESSEAGFSKPITLHLRIARHGTQSSIDRIVADGLTSAASACVQKALRTYPFVDNDSAPLDVILHFELRRDAEKPLPPATTDHLFNPARPHGTGPQYKPSARSPLVSVAPAITACLQSSTAPYGAVVIDLATHVAHGIDAPTSACIAKATRAITSDRRCSLSFGEMPISELPTIDVADTPVSGDLVARQATLRGSAAPPVSIYGVNVIRAKDDTPMKYVAREMSRVLLAGEDFVLARATKTGWELFDPPSEPFPIIPVPIGTGGFWNRVHSPGQPGMDCECVYFSLISTKTAVWINVSRTTDHIEIKRDANFATALAQELDQQKHSAFFMDRTDVEIAATDDSTYGELLDLALAAEKAGFQDWDIRSINTVQAAPDGL